MSYFIFFLEFLPFLYFFVFVLTFFDFLPLPVIIHIISVVGWGYDVSIDKQYLIIRNSWGLYWWELGFMRLVLGENQFGIEKTCAFATPGNWKLHNKPCYEDGRNCMDYTKML